MIFFLNCYYFQTPIHANSTNLVSQEKTSDTIKLKGNGETFTV